MASPILVAVDLDYPKGCKMVLMEAAKLAETGKADVHLCYVLPYGFYSYVQPFIPKAALEDTTRKAHKDLDALAASPSLAGLSVTCHVRQGGIHHQILILAEELSAGAIVLNAAGAEESGSAMGPVTAHVARHAPCTVLVVR